MLDVTQQTLADAVGVFDPAVGLAGYRLVLRRQDWEWREPVCAGDVITTETTFKDFSEKDGRRFYDAVPTWGPHTDVPHALGRNVRAHVRQHHRQVEQRPAQLAVGNGVLEAEDQRTRARQLVAGQGVEDPARVVEHAGHARQVHDDDDDTPRKNGRAMVGEWVRIRIDYFHGGGRA